jgi:hypothetical protein
MKAVKVSWTGVKVEIVADRLEHAHTCKDVHICTHRGVLISVIVPGAIDNRQQHISGTF